MSNNFFGNNNSNKSGKSSGNKPKFNIMWMYAIIMAVILGIYFTNDVGTSKDVSWTKLKEYVQSGGVDSLVVYSNKMEVKAFPNDSLANAIFKGAKRAPHSSTFKIGRAHV